MLHLQNGTHRGKEMTRDYFSFETIRGKEGEVVCYHVTMIGTIENEDDIRIRNDMGENQDKTRVFGILTLRGVDRKIRVLLNETNSRIHYHAQDDEGNATDAISFVARDWRADEIYQYSAGDRVLIEGRAYLRHNTKIEDAKDELTVTVTGQFLLGRKKRPQSPFRNFLPQE